MAQDPKSPIPHVNTQTKYKVFSNLHFGRSFVDINFSVDEETKTHKNVCFLKYPTNVNYP